MGPTTSHPSISSGLLFSCTYTLWDRSYTNQSGRLSLASCGSTDHRANHFELYHGSKINLFNYNIENLTHVSYRSTCIRKNPRPERHFSESRLITARLRVALTQVRAPTRLFHSESNLYWSGSEKKSTAVKKDLLFKRWKTVVLSVNMYPSKLISCLLQCSFQFMLHRPSEPAARRSLGLRWQCTGADGTKAKVWPPDETDLDEHSANIVPVRMAVPVPRIRTKRVRAEEHWRSFQRDI